MMGKAIILDTSSNLGKYRAAAGLGYTGDIEQIRSVSILSGRSTSSRLCALLPQIFTSSAIP